jgi:hypothetical protein
MRYFPNSYGHTGTKTEHDSKNSVHASRMSEGAMDMIVKYIIVTAQEKPHRKPEKNFQSSIERQEKWDN